MQAVLAASAGEEEVAAIKIQEAIRTGIGFGHFHHSAYHIANRFCPDKQAEAGREVAGFRVYRWVSLLPPI